MQHDSHGCEGEGLYHEMRLYLQTSENVCDLLRRKRGREGGIEGERTLSTACIHRRKEIKQN